MKRVLRLLSILLVPLALFTNSAFAQDTIAPTAICKNVSIFLDEFGSASLSPDSVDNGSYDNQGAVQLSLSQVDFGCDDVGVQEVILTVTDAAGNTASCAAAVTVKNYDLEMLVLEGFQILVKSNVVFENDFEDPMHTDFRNCAPDFAQNLVSSLYGDIFDQQWTVETMQINGPEGQYYDPQAIGGNYCLGMLAGVQDDKIAITFDRKDLDFVNLAMDVSAIDVPRCGGPFGVDVPKFNFKLYNTPSGSFSWGNMGMLLDEGEAQGTVPGANPYTFNWSRIAVDLDASQASNGFVTLVIDQIVNSGYAALDNIIVSSSTDSNKFVNQLFIDEGDTALLRGTFNPGLAEGATLSADFGYGGIDNENGEWNWYFPTTDGPNESREVNITIANNCASETFTFNLIVRNVAPTVTGSNTTAYQGGCNNITRAGAFSDPGADTLTLTTNIGTVTASAINNGSWVWTSDETLEPGSYTVTISATDEDGAVGSHSFTLNRSADGAVASCEDFELNLSEGNEITWQDLMPNADSCLILSATLSQSTFDCDEVGENIVELTITNAFGETTSCTSTVTVVASEMSLSAIADEYAGGYNISCNGAADGVIDLAVSGGCGPYSYSWSNGDTSEDPSGLSAGTYEVTVTDAGGNTESLTIKLSEPAALSASISGDELVYLGYDPKSCTDLESTVNGGVAPYTYSWSTGETDVDINVCPEELTTYSLTVTDANGCQTTATFEVCVYDVQVRNGAGKVMPGKVYMCHFTGNTLSIATSAVEAHLAHGDYLGVCGNNNPCGEEEVLSSAGEEDDLGDGKGKGKGKKSVSQQDNGHGHGREMTKTAHTHEVGNENPLFDLEIFPNPAIDALYMSWSDLSTDVQITMLDASGKVVFARFFELGSGQQKLKINTQEFATGLYTLVFTSEHGVDQEKVLVRKR